jgi:hypothetical protein
VEPPVVTPPANNEPPPAGETPPAAELKKNETSFDEATYLNERFGGKFKTTEEIQNKLKELDELSGKYSAAELKAKELETNLSQAPKFANDYIKGLNDYVSKGGDPKVYERVAGIDVDKLNEKDALVLKYRFEHGLSKEEAEFKVARKYKLSDQLDADDPDVKDARIDLRLDGKEAKKYLAQYKSEQMIPQSVREQQNFETQRQARVDSWKPQTAPFIESLKKIEIPFDEKNSVTFEVPQETINEVTETMQQVIDAVGINPDQEGLQQMKEILLSKIFFRNQKEINRTIKAAVDKQWAKDTHHPSGLKEETPPATPPADKNMDLASFIAQQNGIKNFK